MIFEKFEKRKKNLIDLTESLNKKFNEKVFEITIKDQYYNMKEKIEPHMHIVEIAEKAMVSLGIKPIIKPIRGGTDGSQLSLWVYLVLIYLLVGHNFHGRFEYVPVESMIKATEVIIGI